MCAIGGSGEVFHFRLVTSRPCHCVGHNLGCNGVQTEYYDQKWQKKDVAEKRNLCSAVREVDAVSASGQALRSALTFVKPQIEFDHYFQGMILSDLAS